MGECGKPSFVRGRNQNSMVNISSGPFEADQKSKAQKVWKAKAVTSDIRYTW